jgi:hypothetical protein
VLKLRPASPARLGDHQDTVYLVSQHDCVGDWQDWWCVKENEICRLSEVFDETSHLL